MKMYGIHGANVPVYSPNAISGHTVMLVLAALMHFRKQILNVEACRYGLAGIQGREIRNMNIGIVGAGRIGFTTIRCLSGFGPKKMYAYDPYPNDRVREYAEFVALDELYAKCDVIIYHAILNEDNLHMVNRETIKKMKDGVVLVNTSRGGLFDAEAVLEGIESGKIGALCIDAVEGEHVPAIKSFDEDGRVLYVGSFSKTLSADLRVGFLYGRKELTSKIMAVKNADGQDPLYNQKIIEKCLEKIDYEEHLKEISAVYGKKCRAMAETLKASCPSSCVINIPQGGMFLWVTVPVACDVDAISDAAIKAGIGVVKSGAFAADPKRQGHSFRLNFSAPSLEDIVEGSKRFGTVLSAFCR